MNRALIVIDVQESFRARPEWSRMADPDIARPVDRLVALARDRGDLVVRVLHTEPGTGNAFDPEQGHVRPLAELAPTLPGEPLLTKTAHNCFTTTPLQRLLTEAGVTALWLCGIRAEQCVETTARLGSDLGYAVTFVTDATTTDGVGGLGPAQIVQRTEAVLRDRFARIATVAELEAERAAERTGGPAGLAVSPG
ncbi:cysteine hydrolase family protein [Streptomyces diastaticus]